MKFKEWFIKEGYAPVGKTNLYPYGYGGLGLYPDAYYLPSNADAITYLSIDPRFKKSLHLKPGDHPRIKNMDGKPSWPPKKNANNGDNKPFSINHLPK